MFIAPACRDPLILRDEMHYTMMERGSRRLAAAVIGYRRGSPPAASNDDVMWLVPRHPTGKTRVWTPETIDRQYRDPCVTCGVRADRHRLHGCASYRRGRAA